MKTVFLSGKISGESVFDYRRKFAAVEKELEEEGYIVLNPAMLPPTGFPHDAYLRMCAAMLEECDSVCFLPDWKYSVGSRFEYGHAAAHDKEIILYSNFQHRRRKAGNEAQS